MRNVPVCKTQTGTLHFIMQGALILTLPICKEYNEVNNSFNKLIKLPFYTLPIYFSNLNHNKSDYYSQ